MNDRELESTPAGEAMIADLERLKPEGMTLNAWAVGAGVNRAVWGDIRRHGNPSRRTLEKLLAFAGSSLAEFEALRVGAPARTEVAGAEGLRDRHSGWSPSPLQPIPCMGATAGPSLAIDGLVVPTVALSSRVERHVDRPPALRSSPGLYAFRLPLDTMWPRYRRGRTLIVAPGGRFDPGDDVLVLLASQSSVTDKLTLIGEMVSAEQDWVTVRQFKPEATCRVDRSSVEAIHRVAGEVIESL